MKEYRIFRAPKQADRNLGQHELIGVEIGGDIHAATEDIIRAVTTDLQENPEYAGCDAFAYAPEPMQEFHKTKRYQYYITGVVSPPMAEKNILVDYGIIETDKA